ncbi:substrate-binding domain-containing protein, partial [Streptomyces sp. NRRL S-15]|uniref:substrate-binding domain-containing protein n=1 Tax=Streptomyces sp. NRRL S-15 TaxID=1463886 RepID=UPI0004C51A30
MRTHGNAIAFVTAWLMALSLASCGSNSRAGRDSFTVGLLLPSHGISRWEHSDRPLIEKRLKELCAHCAIAFANAENDATRQRQQMHSMIAKGAAVLILDAVGPKALRSSVQAAHTAGI